MRFARVALASLAVAAVAACGTESPPPDLTFVGYSRTPIGSPGFQIRLAVDRLTLTENPGGPGERVVSATLTTEGTTVIATATADVEAAWDPPYTCEECLFPEVFSFDSDQGPLLVMNYYENTTPSMGPLKTVADELRLELAACAGPWVTQCFEQP